MSYTKGPWRQVVSSVFGPLGVTVVHCSDNSVFGSEGSYSITKKEAKANARLIAAAPDLLEALEEAMSMLGSRLIKDTFGYDWHEKAAAAIAKAKGGE